MMQPAEHLTESPYEKVGKSEVTVRLDLEVVHASMKVLQIGKGNRALTEEEALRIFDASMKALPKRKGNYCRCRGRRLRRGASMKALPKRKGNAPHTSKAGDASSLNESPFKQEGKSPCCLHRPMSPPPQ